MKTLGDLIMSPLAMIQRAIVRRQRLNDARFLMAKAYRGVEYTTLPIISGQKDTVPPTCTWRGVAYRPNVRVS